MITENKRQDIELLLEEVARRYQIKILHAVESGSRAWGFPSHDSDYDIRFIYAHPWRHYLTAFEKKDQMQLASYGDLDGAGWDITKCLRLLYRGNSTLYEWLDSPIVYQTGPAINALHQHALAVFNPAPAFYHYISLAKKKLATEQVENHPKTFLYGLRSLLCARWIAERGQPAPVWFLEMVERFLPGELHATLQDFLAAKNQMREQDRVTVPTPLLAWAVDLYQQLRDHPVPGRHYGDVAPYDEVLQQLLDIPVDD